MLKELCADPATGRYGYDLDHQTGLKPKSLYPALIRLADRRLLEARWEPGSVPGHHLARHLYWPTAAGLAVAAGRKVSHLPPHHCGDTPLHDLSGPPPGDLGAPERRPEDQHDSGPPADDRAQWLLAMAVGWMPTDREEWGRAMLAELDQAGGRRARWRFASSAARTALIPPGSISLAGAGPAGF